MSNPYCCRKILCTLSDSPFVLGEPYAKTPSLPTPFALVCVEPLLEHELYSGTPLAVPFPVAIVFAIRWPLPSGFHQDVPMRKENFLNYKT